MISKKLFLFQFYNTEIIYANIFLISYLNFMKLITIHLPEKYIDKLEELVTRDLYPNRSEAIRMAVRDLLKEELGRLT